MRAYVQHGECQRAAVVPQTRDRVRAIAGSGRGASFEKADFAVRLRRNRNHVSNACYVHLKNSYLASNCAARTSGLKKKEILTEILKP